MSSKCNICGHTIKPNSTDSTGESSKCHRCKAIFCLDGEWDRWPALVNPGGIEKKIDNNCFTLTMKWFTMLGFIGLIMFTIFWNTISLFFFISTVGEHSIFLNLAIALFPATGGGLIYMCFAYFYNSTILKVDSTHLSINHKPLPFFGNKVLEVKQIKQLYIKEKMQQNSESSKVSYYYIIMYVNNEEKKVKLMSPFGTREKAIYIVQELERRLGCG